MAFDTLTEKFQKAFRNITGKGKLTEKNMEEMLKEVRTALLEADVKFSVVKRLIADIKEKAMGQEVLKSLNPSEMVLKIVRDELIELLGEEENIVFAPQGITTVMMVGLQGTGKTTAAAKIANLMKKHQGRRVMLAACDLIRPAAIEQLQTLGKSIGVEVFTLGLTTDAIDTAKKALQYAQEKNYDTVIFDTAGRLHIDDDLMQELVDIKAAIAPNEILLTVDAMSGQSILEVAKTFHDTLAVSGLVVTKFDSDTKGGGVLSVRSETGVPVKFVGVGEKVEDLETFHPDRMVSRIMGGGDLASLIEGLQNKIDMEEAEATGRRMMSGNFDLNDMLSQYEQMGKMGSFSGIMKMIPGLNSLAGQINDDDANKKLKKNKAIIQSMTKEERSNPDILRASRKQRIAKGSGTTVAEVNTCIKEFEKMKKAMTQMQAMMAGGGMPGMPGMGGMGGLGGLRAASQAKKMSKKLRKMNRR